MTGLPLFYRQPEVVRLDEHRHKVFLPPDYRFAATASAVPVNANEFMPLIRHYPIVFSDEAKPTPLAVLGLKQGQNLFVEPDGSWCDGAYVPAYPRRYPFILMEFPQEQPVLAIDMASGCLTDERDSPAAFPLFDEIGEATPQVKEILGRCEAYNHAYLATQAFVKALLDHDMLVERKADLKLSDSDHYSLGGFRVVDEGRLKGLAPDILTNWEQRGWLAAIHLHLASMQNWAILLERIEA